MTRAAEGDLVSIHYTGRFEDGTVFDSSEDRDPLEFVAGGDQLIEGVSRAVIGMEAGQQKTVTVPPEQGYGTVNPALRQSVPLSALPDAVQVGDQLRAVRGDQEIPVWVASLDVESAVIDANHPLAGKTLVFDVQLMSVEAADVDE